MRRSSTIFLAAMLCFASVSEVVAQRTTGGSSSSGLFGSRSLGQGTSARSGTSFGGSGTSGGLTGTPGNAVQQAQADAGQVTGSERFIRDNRQPGAFVGADAADTTTFNSQMQGAAFASGLEQFARNAQQRDFQNQNGGNSSRSPLRPRLVLGFAPTRGVSHNIISTRLSQRLGKLPQLEILENVEVAIVGRTAVLRGRVATDYDRQMIAQIASLEPGVAAVQNDLVVGLENSPPPKAVSPFGSTAPAAVPKEALIDRPAMNQPELAAPTPPRGPQAD